MFRERTIEAGECGERLRGGCDGARIERGEVVPGSSRSLIEEITHWRILYRAGADRPGSHAHWGSRPAFHLMLQPTLGVCSGGTAPPRSSASMAARRSEPVTAIPFPGRLPSNCPR